MIARCIRYAKPIAAIYSILSVGIGPGLIFYALGRDGRIGMDCSDSTWHSVSQAVKDTYYADAAAIMTIGSVVMLAVGLLLLFLLLQYHRGTSKVLLAWSTAFIMIGYALVLTSANTWNCD